MFSRHHNVNAQNDAVHSLLNFEWTLDTPGGALGQPPHINHGLGTACVGTAVCPKRVLPQRSPRLGRITEDLLVMEAHPRGEADFSAQEYSDRAVKQGKHLDILTYPSLAAAVQDEIATKYMALHQRIYDEGLYNCPYPHYCKEIIRYSCLFSLFLVFLSYHWYITCAVFLGLFWVRNISLSYWLCLLTIPASNHVYGP